MIAPRQRSSRMGIVSVSRAAANRPRLDTAEAFRAQGNVTSESAKDRVTMSLSELCQSGSGP
jgi:hypothetical protein